MIGSSPGQHRNGFSARMFILGLVLGVLILPFFAYLYVASGRAPVSAFDPGLPFEDLLTKRPLNAKVAATPSKQAPIAPTEENLQRGAQLYIQNCGVCHGLPVGRVSRIATGMFPPPPQFFHETGAADDPVGETFWKTSNGIRLTGMPGFRSSLSETEIWQISLLLANAKRLPPPVAQELDRAAKASDKGHVR